MSSPPHGSANALRCATCRYPIAGLTQPICPECGSDFRTVGVQRRRWSIFWLIGEVACAAIVVFIIVNSVSGNVLGAEFLPDLTRQPTPVWARWAWSAAAVSIWLLAARFCYRRWKSDSIVPFDEAMLRYPI